MSASTMSPAHSTKSPSTGEAKNRDLRRRRIGIVESDVRNKTISVRLDRQLKHAKYGKYLKRQTVIHAHDEKNEAKVGDVVEIMECRPISKTKSWRFVRLVRRPSDQ